MLRIGIDLDLIGGYGREVLRGLMQYANLVGTWEFIMPHMYARDESLESSEIRMDGMICMVHERRGAERFRRRKIPVVNVAHTMGVKTLEEIGLASVVPDDALVGESAYEYFRERGFRSFAFCGHPVVAWSLQREQAFVKRATEDGFPCATIRMADFVSRAWVAQLPHPVALLAANDRYAWHAIDACRELNIRTPEDIAILGVDNDVLISELVRPTLSSVKPAAFQVGIEAGRMLGALMENHEPRMRVVQVPPEGIFTRHSTEVLMLEDPAVVSAVRYIRLNAAKPISVSDVLEEVMVSRRNLERRFRAALGRSLLQEIRRVHIERACDLLQDTDFDMPMIAEGCGFMSHVRFSTVFHQVMGTSPTAYRRKHRVLK